MVPGRVFVPNRKEPGTQRRDEDKFTETGRARGWAWFFIPAERVHFRNITQVETFEGWRPRVFPIGASTNAARRIHGEGGDKQGKRGRERSDRVPSRLDAFHSKNLLGDGVR